MSLLKSMMKLPPRDWQIDTVRYLLKHKYFILADQMGVGKTISAIACQVWTKKRMLVVCPAYLKSNWAEEFEKFLPEHINYKICKNKNDLHFNDEDYNIMVINYELIKHSEHLFVWSEFVVADEAHYLKSLTSQRTGHFHNFIFDHPPEFMMLMTGTPIKNTAQDLYSLLSLCSYHPYGADLDNGHNILERYPTPVDFEKRFLRVIRIGGYEKVVGSKNLNVLKKYLDKKYLRRTVEQCIEGMPEYLEKNIQVSYKTDKALEEAWNNFNKDAENDISGKALSALNKAAFTIKYVKDLKMVEEGPIIIFTDHRDSAQAIAEKLDNCRVITGSTPPEKRQKIVNDLQEGKMDYLVGTIRSCSTGFTMTASSVMVFNDLSWVISDNDQAMGRIRRMGQKKVCQYHFISGSKNDKHINHLIKSKMKTIKQIMEE